LSRLTCGGTGAAGPALRAWRWLLAALLAAAACARIAPPSGGPEDREAPRVLESLPDSGAVRISADAPIAILFSESMNRSSVQDALRIAPWPGRLNFAWEGNRLLCRPVEGWREATTYTAVLGAPAADGRRNQLAPPLVIAFATGDSLEHGQITGVLHTRALPKAGVPIFLFSWPPGLATPVPPEAPLRPDPLEARRIAETDKEGSFRLSFVPTGSPLLAAALHDRNHNRSYDEGEDLWGFSEEPVVCPDSASATVAIDLYLVYLDEEGDLAGTVRDSACAGFSPPAGLRQEADSLEAILAGERDPSGFLRAETDTLPPVALREAERESLTVELTRVRARLVAAQDESLRCAGSVWVTAVAAADSSVAAEVRTQGEFRIEALAPGQYFLDAFRDLNGDARRQAEEPQGRLAAPVELRAGREVSSLEVEISLPAAKE